MNSNLEQFNLKYQKGQELLDRGQYRSSVQTLEEAKALEWGMSDVGRSARENPELVQWATGPGGQYAKELMEWNQVLLHKQGGLFLCERDAQKLGVVLRLEGRETKRGFCTLWVRSPSERRYME